MRSSTVNVTKVQQALERLVQLDATIAAPTNEAFAAASWDGEKFFDTSALPDLAAALLVIISGPYTARKWGGGGVVLLNSQ